MEKLQFKTKEKSQNNIRNLIYINCIVNIGHIDIKIKNIIYKEGLFIERPS